jgi:hypothetical protein
MLLARIKEDLARSGELLASVLAIRKWREYRMNVWTTFSVNRIGQWKIENVKERKLEKCKGGWKERKKKGKKI